MNNKQIFDTLKSQFTVSDSYTNERNREIKQIREFIQTHNKNDYEIYTNKYDNFLTIIYKGIYYTYNGFSKLDFIKLYELEKGENYAL